MQPELFGPYTLLRRLATGGMGEIWLARRTGAEASYSSLVVVKRIRSDLLLEEGFVQMFLDEGHIAAAIDHPNVVRVHEVGCVDGAYFIAMEYVAGKDLGTLLERLGGPLDLATAIHVMLCTCEGLGFAHGAVGPDGAPLHVVHRDINPQNVLISDSGAVKITDFGIAKVQLENRQATRAGVLKGKFAYLSPEQAQGRPLDLRSDVFALGLLLFEITVGRRANPGRTDSEMLFAAAEGRTLAPRLLVPDYPEPLAHIFQRATAFQPSARPQTVRELQEELLAFQLEHRIAATTSGLAEVMRAAFAAEWAAERSAESAPSVALEEQGPEQRTDSGADLRLPEPADGTRTLSPTQLGLVVAPAPRRAPAPAEEPLLSVSSFTAELQREIAADAARIAAEAPRPIEAVGSGEEPTVARPPRPIEAVGSSEEPTVARPPRPIEAVGSGEEVARAPRPTAPGPLALVLTEDDALTAQPTTERPAVLVNAREELAADGLLEPGAGATAETTPRRPARRGHRLVLGLAIGCFLAGVSLGAYLIFTSPDGPPASPARGSGLDAGPVTTRLTSPGGQVAHRDLTAAAWADAGRGRDAAVDSGATSRDAAREGSSPPTADASAVDAARAPSAVDAARAPMHTGSHRPRGRGELHLTSSPGLTVFWREQRLGDTPLTAALPAGRQRLVLRNPQLHLELNRRVVIRADRRTELEVEVGRGHLELEAPPGTQVEIDGRRRGTTPLKPIELYEGHHTLRLVHPDHPVPAAKQITIRPDATTRLVHRF